MGLIPFDRVFDVLESRFRVSDVSLAVATPDGMTRLSPVEARGVLYDRSGNRRLADQIWRQSVISAQCEGSSAGDRRLFAIWLALPAVRGTVYRLATRWRIDRRDLESEVLLALLSALEAADTRAPEIGRELLRHAFRQVWNAARARLRERPMADIERSAAAHLTAESPDPSLVSDWTDGWELQVSPPARPDGLSAVVRFSVSPERLESFRLGALADHLGLREIVYRARRPGEGTRIGTLSLRPRGALR
ncbi:hypothetical protein ACFYNO_06940 [Kitasatospora sp. NPDC006697]|uniref:hypothetical protein n=1 Tax=Kitasatospora sp. NPDC006697 TaxID=3364020 RepID=UPI0036B40538